MNRLARSALQCFLRKTIILLVIILVNFDLSNSKMALGADKTSDISNLGVAGQRNNLSKEPESKFTVIHSGIFRWTLKSESGSQVVDWVGPKPFGGCFEVKSRKIKDSDIDDHYKFCDSVTMAKYEKSPIGNIPVTGFRIYTQYYFKSQKKSSFPVGGHFQIATEQFYFRPTNKTSYIIFNNPTEVWGGMDCRGSQKRSNVGSHALMITIPSTKRIVKVFDILEYFKSRPRDKWAQLDIDDVVDIVEIGPGQPFSLKLLSTAVQHWPRASLACIGGNVAFGFIEKQ